MAIFRTLKTGFNMKNKLFFYCLSSISISICAQQKVQNDTLVRTATINAETNNNSVIFSPETPELNQIAGAPKAFYTYFWELGDGNYSTEKTPKHTYKNKGEYEVRFWATNHYDISKPPTARPKKIAISNASNTFQDIAVMSEDFTLQRNREPVPDQEMLTVVSYKNTKDYITTGKLYIFYNEKKYQADNFEVLGIRTYNNEQELFETNFAYTYKHDAKTSYLASSSNGIVEDFQIQQDSTERFNLVETIKESQAIYKNWNILEFDNLQPKEERNIFISLKTTSEMVKDTSAIISVRGVYIPDSNYDNHKVKDMEMEIVTSHDPNKMSSNGTFINYRFVRFKTLKYKIKFQNNGEGPARTIRLETDIPKMLDKSTLQVQNMYPKCDICPKREVLYSCLDTTYTDTQAIFTFKNIYLPGSEQKNVKDYDSTKGFVQYSIKFAKDFHKKKTKSRTAIIFDKNEPVITNYSTTRFLPGISVGAKVGYNSFSKLKDSESYFVGATLSPYKSYRWYWQVELLNNFHAYSSDTQVTDEIVQDAQGFRLRQLTTTKESYQNIDWDVPVLLRYNINNYVGLGAGLLATVSLLETRTEDVLVQQFEGVQPGDPERNRSLSSNEASNAFTNIRTGLLFDATVGFARIGPSLGVRYNMDLTHTFNSWQFYAIWKF